MSTPTERRIPMRRLPAWALAVTALALAPLAHAALYKWTDANGRVVYSDQPPTGNVKYEVVGGAPPPSNPNAVKELAGKEAEFSKRRQDQAEAAAKAEKAGADAVKQRAFCQQVRNQMISLADRNVAIYRRDDKGERVVMDDLARQEEIAKLERVLRDQKCVVQ